MAHQIKHSLVLGMNDKPQLIELKLACISTEWPDANTTNTHYIVESANPPLFAATEAEILALECAVKELQNEAGIAWQIETLRNLLARLKGGDNGGR